MYRAVIIDDEKWVIKSLRALLLNQEYFEITGEAYNGLTGLQLILDQRPDLAFVDIKMPGLGGLELLQAANLEKVDTVFTIISGHAEFAYVQKAMTQNAIGYCLKPFSPTEIQDSILRAYEKVEFLHSMEKKKKEQKEEDLPIFPVKNRIVRCMLSYIHEHCSECISIQQVAEHCSVNPNYASQLFNQEMNKTFSCYVTELRIEQAVKLLQDTDLPVSEIALKTGYRDYFYFAKVFKKTMGITPTAYRNRED